MRGRAEANDLRTNGNGPLIAVRRGMFKLYANSHAVGPLSKKEARLSSRSRGGGLLLKLRLRLFAWTGEEPFKNRLIYFVQFSLEVINKLVQALSNDLVNPRIAKHGVQFS